MTLHTGPWLWWLDRKWLRAKPRQLEGHELIDVMRQPTGGREDDLSRARVEATLARLETRTLGIPYLFLTEASRTVGHHPDPPVYGSLVLADSLDGATDGVRDWRVGPRKDDLMGSLNLHGTAPERALRDAASAMSRVVGVCGEIECREKVQLQHLTAELFTTSGRKLAGILIEEHPESGVLVCFALRVNEVNNHALPIGDTSIRIETAQTFPRDMLLGGYLALLERSLPKTALARSNGDVSS